MGTYNGTVHISLLEKKLLKLTKAVKHFILFNLFADLFFRHFIFPFHYCRFFFLDNKFSNFLNFKNLNLLKQTFRSWCYLFLHTYKLSFFRWFKRSEKYDLCSSG